MKINEVINESDFWQGLKQAGTGLAGAAGGLAQAGTSAVKGIAQAWKQGASAPVGASVASDPTTAKEKTPLQVVDQSGKAVTYNKIGDTWYTPQGAEVTDKTEILALNTRLNAQAQAKLDQNKAAAQQWAPAPAKPAAPAPAATPTPTRQSAAPAAAATPAATPTPIQQSASPEVSGYQVPKGNRMSVQMNQGTYYKMPNGNWYNEFGQILTNRQGIQNLENRVESGGGRMETLKAAKPKTPVRGKGQR